MEIDASKAGKHSPVIQIRQPLRPLSPDLPKYWYGGEAFASHLMDSLSATFPMGEAFFVRSVLHYRDRVEDPKLLEEIRGFAGQEGQHSRVHAEHLEMLLDHGYGMIEGRNRQADRMLRWLNRAHPASSLALTAALEHLTAILARQLLAHPDWFTQPMHPEMASLWRWHALEEAEHKAVAFDVMERAVPSYRRRVLAQLSATLGMLLEISWSVLYMLFKDGLLLRREGWVGGTRFLFGKHGLLRGIGSDYWDWYRRDFHPDDIDDGPLIEENVTEIVVGFAQ